MPLSDIMARLRLQPNASDDAGEVEALPPEVAVASLAELDAERVTVRQAVEAANARRRDLLLTPGAAAKKDCGARSRS